MSEMQAIPEGFSTVTPHLVVDGAAAAIDFYRRALGAEELGRQTVPGGEKLLHATIRIGDSMLMLCDDFPEFGGKSCHPRALGGSPITLTLYVEDVDAAMARAIAAGAEETMPAQDMFWGDRYGVVVDPYGHKWAFATHLRDLSQDEIEAAARAAFGGS